MAKPLITADRNIAKTAHLTATLILGITSFLLLIPSYSGIPVFSKGEFIYIESLGIIFACLALFSVVLYVMMKKVSAINVKNQFARFFIYIFTAGLGIFLLLFVISFAWIRSDVKTLCQEAGRTYGGDCVGSLIRMLDDGKQSFRSRNSAVWALGQLADDRALPVLKSYYTGNIPPREPLHTTLSQYELKKAIKWCEEGNITSWMYWNQANWR